MNVCLFSALLLDSSEIRVLNLDTLATNDSPDRLLLVLFPETPVAWSVLNVASMACQLNMIHREVFMRDLAAMTRAFDQSYRSIARLCLLFIAVCKLHDIFSSPLSSKVNRLTQFLIDVILRQTWC